MLARWATSTWTSTWIWIWIQMWLWLWLWLWTCTPCGGVGFHVALLAAGESNDISFRIAGALNPEPEAKYNNNNKKGFINLARSLARLGSVWSGSQGALHFGCPTMHKHTAAPLKCHSSLALLVYLVTSTKFAQHKLCFVRMFF